MRLTLLALCAAAAAGTGTLRFSGESGTSTSLTVEPDGDLKCTGGKLEAPDFQCSESQATLCALVADLQAQLVEMQGQMAQVLEWVAPPSPSPPAPPSAELTGGAPIGDMVINGGLAAAFDGNADVTYHNSARKDPSAGAYVGKDWTLGSSRVITGVKLFAPQGYTVPVGYTSPIEGAMELRGWDEAGAECGDGSSASGAHKVLATLDDLGVYPDANGFTYELGPADIDTSTGYRCHALHFVGNDAGGAVAELEFYGYTLV